jgi:hypothetical protein
MSTNFSNDQGTGTVVADGFVSDTPDGAVLGEGGTPTSVIGQNVQIIGSDGPVSIQSGAGAIVVDNGVKLLGIPTADPHVLHEVWNNAGVLTISAG